MDRNRTNLMEWFRKFVYTDIGSLSDFEITRLWINIALIKEYGFLDQEISRKSLASLLHIATERSDLISNESLKREQSEFSDKFHGVLNNIRKKTQREELTNPFDLHIFVSVKAEEDSVRVKFDQSRNALCEDNRLFLAFLNTIKGLPLDTFKRCLECGQWFFHFSKRDKFYCNNRCAARKGNRERRARIKDEDPGAYEKELKESAKRAKKSYDRKVKVSSGKNVKITRKPRKK